MAERRMFTKKIIDSDAFLDLPLSTQSLYFHLSMRADDDGFINNQKTIMRMIGASDDELKLLIAKRFVLIFDSGVIVIKHWKMHNYIQKDRKKDTQYTFEKSMLSIGNDNVYRMDTECIQVGRLGKDRLGKDRLGKDRLGKDKVASKPKKRNVFTPPTIQEIEEYIQERNSNVNPKHFFEYYDANSWHDAKGNKVKSWKQRVISWEGRDNTTTSYKKEKTLHEQVSEWNKEDDYIDTMEV